MKTIYFFRSGPYDYVVPGKDLYDSFNDAAKKTYDPHLLPNAQELFTASLSKITKSVKKAYSSSDIRSQETARFMDPHAIPTPLLREIVYSMDDLLPKNQFYKDGKPDVNTARTTFVNKLITNQLEPYHDLMQRVEQLIKFLTDQKYDAIACVTHGFYLKVIEAYIKDREIVSNPEKLTLYFDGRTETFKFFEGFIAQESNGTISFSSYIKN